MWASAILPVTIGSSSVTLVCGSWLPCSNSTSMPARNWSRSKRPQSTPISSPTRRASSVLVRRSSVICGSVRLSRALSGGSHGGLGHVNRLDNDLLAADHAVIGGLALRAAEADDQLIARAGGRRGRVPLGAAGRAGKERGGALPLELGAFADRLLGSYLEVEAQVLGDDLTQAAYPDANDRDRPAPCMALGRGDDGLGDGEFVHLRSPH